MIVSKLTTSISDDLKSLSRAVRVLLVDRFLMNASNFAAFPLMAVYMAQHLGFSATQIGSVLTIHLRQGALCRSIQDKWSMVMAVAFSRRPGWRCDLSAFQFWSVYQSAHVRPFNPF